MLNVRDSKIAEIARPCSNMPRQEGGSVPGGMQPASDDDAEAVVMDGSCRTIQFNEGGAGGYLGIKMYYIKEIQ